MVGVASIVNTSTSTPILRLLSYLVVAVTRSVRQSVRTIIKFTC